MITVIMGFLSVMFVLDSGDFGKVRFSVVVANGWSWL